MGLEGLYLPPKRSLGDKGALKDPIYPPKSQCKWGSQLTQNGQTYCFSQFWRWLKCICLSPCGCAHYQGPVSAFVNNFMFGKTKYLLGKRAHTGVKSSNPGVAKL